MIQNFESELHFEDLPETHTIQFSKEWLAQKQLFHKLKITLFHNIYSLSQPRSDLRFQQSDSMLHKQLTFS